MQVYLSTLGRGCLRPHCMKIKIMKYPDKVAHSCNKKQDTTVNEVFSMSKRWSDKEALQICIGAAAHNQV